MSHKLTSYTSIYLPKTPYVFVYMFQQVEYSPGEFMKWGNRWPDFRKVMRRKKLVKTSKSMALLVVAYSAWVFGLANVIFFITQHRYMLAAEIFIGTPGLVVLALLAVTGLGQPFLRASRAKIVKQASEKIQNHKGIKIAVLGSYGKTTAKEVLATVLGEGKKVAFTPGNMNVEISHARWIMNKLHGDEEIIISEYGEGAPGDISMYSRLTHPDYAVLTGYAPNHLDNYKTEGALVKDLVSITDFVKPDKLFVAEQAAEALKLSGKDAEVFDDKTVLGWKISAIATDFEGTDFIMKKDSQILKLHSGIMGEHIVPVLALAAAFADTVGMSHREIIAGMAKTKPFEHRMEPRHVNGAWIIDDTYNGNIEGMRAGLEMLKSLPAKKRVYVTPGLVEQGTQTDAVHRKLGEYIAKSNPDKVVLMQNSVTSIIRLSMSEHDYKGELVVENDPLSFYQNLQYTLAAGDVVLMQNDWTDNYN